MPDAPQLSDPDTGRIVVGGTGRVSVEPDVADLRLGVSVARPTVDTARAVAAETMDAILAAVAAAGVDRRDVRTTLLSVQPRYDYRENQPPVLTGYELANVVEVTVRDLARLGDVVDGTLRAGATSMDGLSFRVADPAPRRARGAATRDGGGPRTSRRPCRGGRAGDRRRVGHRRGRHAVAAGAPLQGGPDDGRRGRVDTGRGRLPRDRRQRHGHLPGALIPASRRRRPPGAGRRWRGRSRTARRPRPPRSR